MEWSELVFFNRGEPNSYAYGYYSIFINSYQRQLRIRLQPNNNIYYIGDGEQYAYCCSNEQWPYMYRRYGNANGKWFRSVYLCMERAKPFLFDSCESYCITYCYQCVFSSGYGWHKPFGLYTYYRVHYECNGKQRSNGCSF
jgi:hypothetical protein